jgi:hypothetical protein
MRDELEDQFSKDVNRLEAEKKNQTVEIEQL